jgi:hypothetical protein
MSTPETRKDSAGAAAGAAVATAAAAYLVKRALAGTGRPALAADPEDEPARSLPVILESAPDMLLPLVEHAAEAAGRWVARNAPELVRDQLLPRFIGAFTDETKRRG